MKKYFLMATIGLIFECLNNVDAQNVQFGGGENRPRQAAAQGKLIEYQNKYRHSGQEGRAKLDEVYSLGLEVNADNIKLIRSLLASNISFDEKIALTRILASLYSPQSTNEFNNAILSDLRGLAASGHKELGRTATYAYSRSGYFPDSVEMLTRSRDIGYFGDQDFYGELAHLLPYAPEDVQSEIIAKIKSSRNLYAAEILAAMVNNPEHLTRLPLSTRGGVMALLAGTEPKFSQATGTFSFSEGIQFTYWLHAMATLRAPLRPAILILHTRSCKTRRLIQGKLWLFLFLLKGSQSLYMAEGINHSKRCCRKSPAILNNILPTS
jgi:hypothetical protein